MKIGRLFQSWENQRMRVHLGKILADEISGLSPTEKDTAFESHRIESLWQRIEADLRVSQKRAPSSLALLKQPRVLAFGSFAVVAVLALSLYLGEWTNLSQENVATFTEDFGVKGGRSQNLKAHAELRSLRFAILGKDGNLQPGSSQMQIKVGTPLVFSVEMAGNLEALNSGLGVPVSLSYKLLPAGETRLIVNYSLHQQDEILRGKSGYIAFQPSQPGHYQFTLKRNDSIPKSQAAESGSASQSEVDHAVGFSIQVTLP